MGKVISFEGLDKSGKHSAMDFACELLEQKGYSVYKLSFPQYDTPIGQLIRQYLTNQLELTPKAFELLLAADKVNSSDKLNELLCAFTGCVWLAKRDIWLFKYIIIRSRFTRPCDLYGCRCGSQYESSRRTW